MSAKNTITKSFASLNKLLITVLVAVSIACVFVVGSVYADMEKTVYSRTYEPDGLTEDTPDEHEITYEIDADNSSITWPLIIDNDFVTANGSVYRVSGVANNTSVNGVIRVETATPIVLILDNADFSTGNQNGLFSPLAIGSDRANPKILADVTLIVLDETVNSFESKSISGAGTSFTAGISVEKGSRLTIQSGYSALSGSQGNQGSLTAIGTRYAAGIGGGPNRCSGDITITGGNITAKGNSGTSSGYGNGAGIGGGGGNSDGGGDISTINIYGDATVYAESFESGAGIGGGGTNGNGVGGNTTSGPGDGGTINIYGNANVSAKSRDGAAIGGGGRSALANSTPSVGGTGGTINISGNAIIEAYSTRAGAGIGGGGIAPNNASTGGSGGNITISGNTRVFAHADGRGAAIGGGGATTGIAGAGGNISISGNPKIAAHGLVNVDIGHGTAENSTNNGALANFTISSGNVHAPKSDPAKNDFGTPVTMQVIKANAGEQLVYNVTSPPASNAYEYKAAAFNLTTFSSFAVPGVYSGDAYLWLPYDVYSVNFVTNGGTPVPSTLIVLPSSRIETAPQEPERDPVEFDDWYAKSDFSDTPWVFGASGNTVTDNVTLYARWIAPIGKVVYFADENPDTDVTGTPPIDNNTYNPSDVVTVLDNTDLVHPENKEFAGWKNEATGELFDPDDTFVFSGGTILAAQWGKKVYSRNYSDGGQGLPLPDRGYIVSYEINPDTPGISFPVVIDDNFVEEHGTVYRLTGTASRISGRGNGLSSDPAQVAADRAATGLVRVETTKEIILVADGLDFSTEPPSGQSPYLQDGPLTIGFASNDDIIPIIRANVTLIVMDDTINNFSTTANSTQKGGKQAGISVETGSRLTIKSGFTRSQSVDTLRGNLNATGGVFGAGIGAGPNRRAGTTVITGGIITATSGNSSATGTGNGAGIGGGGGNTWGGGSQDGIEIYGDAVVVATSLENGAGLGGAGGGALTYGQVAAGPGDSGPISIYGDTHVTAISSGTGAGIGGGGRSESSGTLPAGSGDEISIYGNTTIVARSDGDGAGIGGAGVHDKVVNINGGAGGTIHIYGNANVTANSKSLGAGIGGGGNRADGANGNAGKGGTITIEGNSIVNATSSERGAGIGGGGSNGRTKAGSSGTIVISNRATVNGTSSGNGAGIGGGGSNNSSDTFDAKGLSQTAGPVDFIHIFGGDERSLLEDAIRGPSVVTQSDQGTDLGAGRNGANGTKGSGDNIVITSGSVRAWDSDVVRSGTEFGANSVELVMAQARNRVPGETIVWPINADTFTSAAGIGDYNYVATASAPDNTIAYLWVPYAYSVTYLPGDAVGAVVAPGNVMPIEPDILIYNDEVQVQDIDRFFIAGNIQPQSFEYPGHRFTGWKSLIDTSTNAGDVVFQAGESFFIKDNVDLEAQWEETYKVTYSPGDGSGAPFDDPVDYIEDEQAIVLGKGGFSKGTDDFVGWKVDGDTSNKIYSEGSRLVISGNVTLEAQWAPTSITVSYEAPGSDVEGDIPNATVYPIGAKVVVIGNSTSNPLERDGYSLYGWSYNGDIYKPGDVFDTDSSDVTFTAVWGHSVTYREGDIVAERGTVPVDINSPYLPYSASATPTEKAKVLSLDDSSRPLAKAGYTFDCWEDGNGNEYAPGDFLPQLNENVILTAKWNAIKYSVTYQSDPTDVGVTGAPPVDFSSYDYGAHVPIMGNTNVTPLAKDGYEFAGWTPDTDPTSPMYKLYRPGSTLLIDENTRTLTAVFKQYHTVDFETNGGSPIAEVQVADGGHVPKPVNPTRPGYSFDGWYTDASFTSPWDAAAFIVDEDKTLYAKWEVVEYTITYDRGTGDVGSALPPTQGPFSYSGSTPPTAQVSIDPPPSHADPLMTFIGWFDASSGRLYQGGDNIVVTKDIILVASYGASSTYTFDVNGGTAPPAELQPQTIPYGQKANEPTVPTKTGYIFEGWGYMESGINSIWDFGSAVYTDRDLVAQWSPISYTLEYLTEAIDATNMPLNDFDIRYYYDAGPGGSGITNEIIISDLIPEREGYVFTGWVTNQTVIPIYPSGQNSFEPGDRFYVDGSQNAIRLYAQWAICYSLTYDVNGGNNDGPDTEHDIVSVANYPLNSVDIPTHDDVGGNKVIFAGWSAASTGPTIYSAGNTPSSTIIDAVNIPSDVTVYAVWSYDRNGDNIADLLQTLRTVTYDKGGTSVSGSVPTDSNNYLVDETATILGNTGPLEYPGHLFTGWKSNIGGDDTLYKSGDELTMPDDNVVLTAQWVATFDVIFNSDGGSSVATENVVDGDTVPEPAAPTKPGYEFDGWYLDMALTVLWDFENDAVTRDMTLYAKWIADDYNVTYEAPDADGGIIPTDTADYNIKNTVTIKTGEPTRADYTFVGWLNSVDGITYQPGQTFIITNNTTLVAQWKKAYFTVTYIGNGADAGTPPAKSSYAENATVSLSGQGDLEKTGRDFNGWIDQNGKLYNPGESFVISEDMTFTAQWVSTSNEYTITYVGGSGAKGDAPIDDDEYSPNTTATLLGLSDTSGTPLTKIGYSFVGWYDVGLDIPYPLGTTDFTITEDTILVAQWDPNDYYVYYTSVGADDGYAPSDGGVIRHYKDNITVLDNEGVLPLVKAGFAFRGWIDSDENIYLPGDSFVMPPNDVTFDPLWKEIVTFSYGSDGAKSGSAPTDSNIYAVGDTIVIKGSGTLENIGYAFGGWSDGINTYQEGDEFVIKSNSILQPVWVLSITYSVTYDVNGADGGSIPVDANAYVPGDTVTVSDNIPTKTGFTFSGWHCSQDGVVYNGNEKISISGNITFTAVWTAVETPSDPEDPAQPEDPTQPKGPVAPEDKPQSSSPNTGDAVNILFSVLLLLISMFVVTTIFISMRRKNHC